MFVPVLQVNAESDSKYDINTLLRNYSVVTLGQKNYEANTVLSTKNLNPGSASIFHITAQFLVNGDLAYAYVNNQSHCDGFKDTGCSMRLDYLYTDKNVNSALNGDIKTNAYQHVPYYNATRRVYTENMGQTVYTKWFANFENPYYSAYDNVTYFGNSNLSASDYSDCSSSSDCNYQITFNNNWSNGEYKIYQVNSSKRGEYINFGDLKSSIIEQQKQISKGTELRKIDDHNLRVKIGDSYVVDNFDGVMSIFLDDFDENESKVTVITINQSGTIYFPGVYINSSHKYVETNDRAGRNVTVYSGEPFYGKDTYFGNIIWNFPNATHIKFSGVPLIGHVIAPNADVEFLEETHYAGAIIANSLYAAGKSEAHFYPLQVDLEPKYTLPVTGSSNTVFITLGGVLLLLISGLIFINKLKHKKSIKKIM